MSICLDLPYINIGVTKSTKQWIQSKLWLKKKKKKVPSCGLNELASMNKKYIQILSLKFVKSQSFVCNECLKTFLFCFFFTFIFFCDYNNVFKTLGDGLMDPWALNQPNKEIGDDGMVDHPLKVESG